MTINNESKDISDDLATLNFDLEYFDQVRSIVGLWLLIVCIIGTPANALVIRCAWKLCHAKRSSTLLYQYFVLSMSVADFIFVSIVASCLFCQYYLNIRYTKIWCKLIYIVSHCSSVSSSLNLLCLNLDKFIAIFRPLHHALIVTRRRVLLAVVLCWLLSLCWSIFFVLGPALTYKDPCSLNVASFGYYLIFTICFFVMPTSIAAILGTFIAVIAYRNERQQVELRFAAQNSTYGRRNTAVSTSTCTSNSNSHHNNNHHSNNLTISRARTFTFVFATTAWSCLTYLPYRIMYPIYVSGEFEPWHLPVGFAFFAILATNPVGNALITISTQKRYRILLIKFWKASLIKIFLRKLSKICHHGEKQDANGNGGTIGMTSDTGGRSVPHDDYSISA